MEYRRLGSSGFKVGEISYGNWITHGGQVDDDTATACVHAALDAGVTTFEALSTTPVDKVQAILDAGGSKFNLAKPETWAEQAALAAKGDWAAFDALTKELVGGVRK